MSRKKIGQPISLTLSPEHKAWIDSKIRPGGSRTEVIRRIIDNAFRKESDGIYKRWLAGLQDRGD